MTVFDFFTEAKAALKAGDRDKARDMADMGILQCADARAEGMPDDGLIDDIKLSLWFERFWYFLEKNDLMLATAEEGKIDF
jgi:hypothetical protein